MSAKKTKILIVSDSPILPTGMGEVIRLIFGALLERYPDQYELHQVGLFHSYSVATPRWPVYPTKGAVTDKAGTPFFLIADANGEITFRELVPKIRPDIVFAFNDTHRVLHLCTPPEQREHKLVLYVNLDGFPIVADQGPLLNNADLLLTKSQFSSRVAKACLPSLNQREVHYMYSPADVSRFKPVSDTEKERLRADLFPKWMPKDAFLLGWIGRNQWRKQVWTLYEVIHHLRRGGYLLCHNCGRVSIRGNRSPRGRSEDFAPAAKRNDPCRHCRSSSTDLAQPLEDVFLWLHMPEDIAQQDWQRSLLETHFHLGIGEDIHYTEGHRIGDFKQTTEMPALYQISDCLLYLSGGEGFGLPGWEAMCCGIPVVYTNYSSHAEYLGRAKAGLPVGGVLQPEQGTAIWRMIANVQQVIEAVRKVYFDRSLGKALGANGRAFVEGHTVETQAERWHDLFQKLTGNRKNATAGVAVS